MFLPAICCFTSSSFPGEMLNQRINNRIRKINEPHLRKQELLLVRFLDSAAIYTTFKDHSGFRPWAQLWVKPLPSISFHTACRALMWVRAELDSAPLRKGESLVSVSFHRIRLCPCVRRSWVLLAGFSLWEVKQAAFSCKCGEVLGFTLDFRIRGCSLAADSFAPRDSKDHDYNKRE